LVSDTQGIVEDYLLMLCGGFYGFGEDVGVCFERGKGELEEGRWLVHVPVEYFEDSENHNFLRHRR